MNPEAQTFLNLIEALAIKAWHQMTGDTLMLITIWYYARIANNKSATALDWLVAVAGTKETAV